MSPPRPDAPPRTMLKAESERFQSYAELRKSIETLQRALAKSLRSSKLIEESAAGWMNRHEQATNELAAAELLLAKCGEQGGERCESCEQFPNDVCLEDGCYGGWIVEVPE